MIKIIKLTILVCLVAYLPINAQVISLYINSNQGILAGKNWESGNRGGSMGLNFSHPLNNNYNYIVGTEIALVPWGTDIYANLGVRYSKNINTKWQWTVSTLTNQGVALFRPKSLYVYGFSGLLGMEYKLTQTLSLGIQTGLKYYNCVAYKKYSLISSYLQIPFQINMNIKLNTEK